MLLFRTLDLDQNGAIEESEFKAFLAKISVQGASTAVVKMVMAAADANDDGHLDYHEVRFMSSFVSCFPSCPSID